MSGHSHWANVRYKKDREDKKRGKIFSRLSRQITQAVREGGKDPEFNLALKAAIGEARSANMPKDKIENAIKAGVESESRGSHAVFEGYGPGGAAFLVNVETDNKNRTLSEIRRIFDSFGGSLGEAGSAAFVFEGSRPKFEIELPKEKEKERVKDMLISLREHPDVVEILTNVRLV